jgi:hypothetical protein
MDTPVTLMPTHWPLAIISFQSIYRHLWWHQSPIHKQDKIDACFTAVMMTVECDEQTSTKSSPVRTYIRSDDLLGVGGNATVTGRNHHMKMFPV